jgi:hypothetical protein
LVEVGYLAQVVFRLSCAISLPRPVRKRELKIAFVPPAVSIRGLRAGFFLSFYLIDEVGAACRIWKLPGGRAREF